MGQRFAQKASLCEIFESYGSFKLLVVGMLGSVKSVFVEILLDHL